MPSTGFDLRRVIGLSLTIGALGFGLSACGGGDDEESPPETAAPPAPEVVALTTESLIQQGDAICAEVNAAVGAIDNSTADETTKASQREGIYDGLAARLGDLGTPSDGEPPTQVIQAIQALADGTGDREALLDAADEYGFVDCAEAPAATVSPIESPDSTGAESPDSTESYTPPVTEAPQPVAPEAPAPPSTGGGVAPPGTGGGTGTGGGSGSGGGSSGGSSSGGIGPG